MANRLQQQLDGNEPRQQPGIRLIADVTDIESSAQRLAFAAQHQQPHVGCFGQGDRCAQILDQDGIERIALVRPPQRRGQDAIGERRGDQAHAAAGGIDHRFGRTSAEYPDTKLFCAPLAASNTCRCTMPILAP